MSVTMFSSQIGSYEPTMASSTWQSEQQQKHPTELYNYTNLSESLTSQIQRYDVQSNQVFDCIYNDKTSNDTTDTLSDYYDFAVKSQFLNYSLATWPQIPTEIGKQQQQQQQPTGVQNNSTSTPTISSNSLVYPWTLTSPWDWMSQVSSISPLRVSSEITPFSHTSTNYDFSLTSSVINSPQTPSTSGQSTPNFTIPSQQSTLPYTSALQLTAVELNKKPTPIRRRYFDCKCSNCSSPGGNSTIGSDGYHVHICHFSNCKKTFSNVSILKAHLRSSHDVDPHVCKLCGKKFVRKDGLGRHMKIHKGEKKYECPHCYDRFMRKDHLTKHMYKMHENPKKKGGKKNVVMVEE